MDVPNKFPGILQDLTREAHAGNALPVKTGGKGGDKKKYDREIKKGLQLKSPQTLTGIGAGGESGTPKTTRVGGF